MKPRPLLPRRLPAAWAVAFASVLASVSLAMGAAEQSKGPTGKVYVVAAVGDSQIAAGGKIVPSAPKAVFPAGGAQIATKPKGHLTIVFSNGTGAYLGPDTQIEVKRFSQESFTASRTDLEREPSVSHTEVDLEQGTLAVSASKLAAGSTMSFLTSLGSFNLLDGNLVVQAGGTEVKFSLLAGAGTVYGGSLDLGGQVVHAGEQAVILPGPPGQPNVIQISKILPDALARLEALSDQAYAARKTVFFESDAGDLTPVPVVPESLPVEAAISPSKLPN